MLCIKIQNRPLASKAGRLFLKCRKIISNKYRENNVYLINFLNITSNNSEIKRSFSMENADFRAYIFPHTRHKAY